MYTPELLEGFALKVSSVYPAFNQQDFLQAVFDSGWESRELKDRYRHIAQLLAGFLPADYDEAIQILEGLTGECRGFPYIFFPEFVSLFGLEHWDTSLRALRSFTPSSSSEFAVRPFIELDQERMLAQMLAWTQDPDEHVRRLASEGCRPRLPWGKPLRRLIADPLPLLPILNALLQDESEYVRRSVANNLNDISKDHPEVVLKLAAAHLGASRDTDRLLKHACRTLLKKGSPDALRIFGFGSGDLHTLVDIGELRIEPETIRLGEQLRFSFRLAASLPASFRLQYAIDYVKANGKTAAKRFHLPERKAFSGAEVISWSVTVKDFTTRKHYPGYHRVSILVNGEERAFAGFMLEIPGE
jgi:3-methyladenine DNA glycosylase AlkC